MNADEEVVIFGMGFVGLTLAVSLSNVGISVIGIDTNVETINQLNSGKPHFYEDGLEMGLQLGVRTGKLKFSQKIEKSDCSRTFIVTVGTPLKGNQLDESSIDSVISQIIKLLSSGDLVILRSTVSIGMTSFIQERIKEKVAVPFSIAMCPERTLEGIALQELRSLPQIIGASDQESRDRAKHLFENLTDQILELDSFEAAEISKLSNNIARDVKFALANEVAIACERVGVRFEDVQKATTAGYPREGLSRAGYVAGPCLEKDSWIFLESINKYKKIPGIPSLEYSVIKSARYVNEYLPEYVISCVNEFSATLSGEKKVLIAHLGLAFKGSPPTNDIRGSDSLKVIGLLSKNSTYENYVIDAELNDSEVRSLGLRPIGDMISSPNILVIHNDHQNNLAYAKNIIEQTQECIFIFDIWNLFRSDTILPARVTYKSLGNQHAK